MLKLLSKYFALSQANTDGECGFTDADLRYIINSFRRDSHFSKRNRNCNLMKFAKFLLFNHAASKRQWRKEPAPEPYSEPLPEPVPEPKPEPFTTLGLEIYMR